MTCLPPGRLRAAISIDLDGIACYYKIHGLGTPPPELEHVILERALPRAAALFSSRGIHVTWFVIGRDVDTDSTAPHRDVRIANAARLRALAAAGDELGNHSYSHPYDLARLGPGIVDAEISGCDRVLRTLTPTLVRGFRAPGYDVSPAMLDSLARLGYRYDSSVFPAPGYYAAKLAVMGALVAIGRPSGAVLTNPRALVSPIEPYRPAMTAPWRRGQAPLVELPIAVTAWTRLPAIGTTLLVSPPWLRERVIAAMAHRFWNFELHGIDFADADKDGIPGELVERQPDLQIPIDRKLDTLERILDTIAATHTFTTLADAGVDAQRSS